MLHLYRAYRCLLIKIFALDFLCVCLDGAESDLRAVLFYAISIGKIKMRLS